MGIKRVALSEQIREIIRNSGMTGVELGEEADVDNTTISRFMTGNRGMTVANLDKIAHALKIDAKSSCAVKGSK